MSEQTKRIDTGGPAFARPASIDPTNGTLHDGDRVIDEQAGMTLRDYFAAHASDAGVAFVINDYLKVVTTNEPDTWNTPAYSEYHCKKLAAIEARYRLAVADAMIFERKRGVK